MFVYLLVFFSSTRDKYWNKVLEWFILSLKFKVDLTANFNNKRGINGPFQRVFEPLFSPRPSQGSHFQLQHIYSLGPSILEVTNSTAVGRRFRYIHCTRDGKIAAVQSCSGTRTRGSLTLTKNLGLLEEQCQCGGLCVCRCSLLDHCAQLRVPWRVAVWYGSLLKALGVLHF